MRPGRGRDGGGATGDSPGSGTARIRGRKSWRHRGDLRQRRRLQWSLALFWTTRSFWCHIMELPKNEGVTGVRNFTEHEVEIISNNYSTSIGKGGFGEVFKGFLDDDVNYPVAVKRYIRGDCIKEFMEEVNIHSQINHKNAVKLIGYCIGQSTLTMVTEFISKGNLEDILHNSGISIPLDTRLGIAIGCAQALSYMHSMHLSSDSPVCHGDVKPANILLDDNLIAKVSDFGLSRLISGGITQYTMHVKGSLDYMDPIYIQLGRLTPKNDVYSFGAVLLELITRKRVRDGSISLIATFNVACAKERGLRELFDAEIAEGTNAKILDDLGKIAAECLSLKIHKRPRMNDVMRRLVILWRALRGGESTTGQRFFQGTRNELRRGSEPRTSSVGSTSSMLRLLGISQRRPNNSDTRIELGNVRIFTREELKEATQNYSYVVRQSWDWKVYGGSLEDNTLVAVRRYSVRSAELKDGFANEAAIMSQINHKNIIKLLGCCLDGEIPILVHELHGYRSYENLAEVLLLSYEEFPMEFRLNIAVKTAEALAYLHSSAAGVLRHGYVRPSAILIDGNFVPKLSVFSLPMTKHKYDFLDIEAINYTDPFYRQTGHLTIKSDAYGFGVVLLELLSRERHLQYSSAAGESEAYLHRVDSLVSRFTKAYRTDDSGKELFHKEITSHENSAVLDEIGRLALKCLSEDPDERPAMEEVSGHLEMLKRSWKKENKAKGAQR